MKTFAVLVGLIFPLSAHAYLDPGTGSIILQGLIAGIAAGLVVMKTYWHKIKTFFGKTPSRRLTDEENTGVESDSDTKR